MRIVLLGPPGSAKVAIGRRFTDDFGYPAVHVSRELAAVAAESSYLESLTVEPGLAGRIGDEVLISLLETRFREDDMDDGFVIIDFPREVRQADELDVLLEKLHRPIDLVLMIEMDPDELMERLVGQILCDACGAQYNLYVNPPLVDGVCDGCGSRVKLRPEDYEESIANKLRIYEIQVAPLLHYYQLRGKLRRLDGSGSEQQLWQRVKKIVEAMPPVVIETLPVSEDAVAVDASTVSRSKPGKSRGKSDTRTRKQKKSAGKSSAAKKKGGKKRAPKGKKSAGRK